MASRQTLSINDSPSEGQTALVFEICFRSNRRCFAVEHFSRRDFRIFVLENLSLMCEALTYRSRRSLHQCERRSESFDLNAGREKISPSALSSPHRRNTASHKAFRVIQAWNNFCTTRVAVIHSLLDRRNPSRFESVGREKIFRE